MRSAHLKPTTTKSCFIFHIRRLCKEELAGKVSMSYHILVYRINQGLGIEPAQRMRSQDYSHTQATNFSLKERHIFLAA